MNICPFCQQHNREGVYVCEHCQRSLSSFAVLPTRRVAEEPTAVSNTWHGSAAYDPDVRIILYIRDVAKPLVLPIQPRVRMGRVHEDGADMDLDLTAYGAFEKGVSAQHAMLERTATHLALRDMGSTNGTYLNGQKLIPDQPVAVQDGDILKLGGLTARLYLETTSCVRASH